MFRRFSSPHQLGHALDEPAPADLPQTLSLSCSEPLAALICTAVRGSSALNSKPRALSAYIMALRGSGFASATLAEEGSLAAVFARRQFGSDVLARLGK